MRLLALRIGRIRGIDVRVEASALAILALIAWGLAAGALPEHAPGVHLASSTVATAIAFGVVAVAVAPVVTLRRLRRMDIPSTLRVVE
jgi:putative ABC transport system permease protein